MARVFKQTYTKPLPGDAEIITRKGRTLARFKDSRGRACTAPVSQDGSRVILQTAKWYIDYKDADGVTQRVPGFKDKQATEQHASDLEKQAEQVRSGYKPREHEHLRRLLSEHLVDFGRFLASKDSGAEYVKQTIERIERVFSECGFRFWGDISASRITDCLAGMAYRGRRLSSQTRQYYSQSIRQFCRWMVRNDRANASPVEHLPSVKVVPTFERRAATPEELRRLLETVRATDPSYGLTGNERAMLYRFAAETGLRAKEIRSLRLANFNFDECLLTVVAGYTKNKDRCEIPLKKQTAAELKDFMAGKAPSVPAFRLPSKDNMARMLEADLPGAGIPYVDELGRKFDFHALRHTFITSLRTAPARVAQSLARHKSSRMTDRYTHIRLLDERTVVEGAIPDYSIASDRAEQKATGTDDLAANPRLDNKQSDKPTEREPQTPAMQALTENNGGFLIRRSGVRIPPDAVSSISFSDHR